MAEIFVCTLPVALKDCPHRKKDSSCNKTICSCPSKGCGFREEEKTQSPSFRAEKWYEKYKK